ncbi:MAG TPA: hypothetical protein VGA38_06580 [Candidatus Limnocylindria bacterium]
MVKAFVLAASLALVAGGTGSGASDRLTRSADAMEHVRGVRFSLVATSVASGGGSVAGDLALEYRATGELVPPDRLRLTVTTPRPAVLLIVGKTITLDGEPASPAVLRTLASPIAVLEQLREPGSATYRGLGFARGSITARYRIDRADRGVVEVEIGLLDELVRRQTFTVAEAAPAEGLTSGPPTPSSTGTTGSP